MKHGTSKTAQPRNAKGCSRKGYAEAKGIPLNFLKTLGLSNSISNGVRTLAIPYYDMDGNIINTRFRTTLKGPDECRWEKKAEVIPYGFWKLAEAKEAGYVVLVEGEGDCHTLWYKKFPAIGIPDGATWKEEWGANYLADIPTIYVVINPDISGKHLIANLQKSDLRDRIKVVDLGKHRDPSTLYLAAPKKFKARFNKAIKAATPLRPIDMEAIKHIAENKNILKLFTEDLRKCGIVGEKNVCQLLYLGVTPRFFADPVSIVVKGGSSGGKSYTTGRVLKFFPDEAYFDLTSMSPKALIYTETSFKHRFLWIYEAAGLDNPSVRYLVRTLLSEGKIKHMVTEKLEGKFVSRTIEKEGPSGLILTTTLKFIGTDQENRLLSVTINASPEQTRKIMVGQGEEAEGEVNSSGHHGVEGEEVLPAWLEFQEWLRQSDHRVVIPYAVPLAELINPNALRTRRDFPKVRNLIKAHALLHQANRDRDPEGNVIAKFTDYNRVYHLIKGPLQMGHETAVPQHIREMVEEVGKANEENELQGISVTKLAKLLGLNKSNASRGATEAKEMGYLKNLEDKRGMPAKYVPANPLPSTVDILPSPKELKAYWEKKQTGNEDR